MYQYEDDSDHDDARGSLGYSDHHHHHHHHHGVSPLGYSMPSSKYAPYATVHHPDHMPPLEHHPSLRYLHHTPQDDDTDDKSIRDLLMR
jgi:hypothetical protein